MAFVDQIYKKLNELYGQGETELFQLEFPARLPDKGTYFYEGSDGQDAQQLKPQTITEAEFQLADDMLPLSHIIGGPNGQKVSTAYTAVLNQLVPSSSADSLLNKSLVPDQKIITHWLEELVDEVDPPHNDILHGVPSDFQKHTPTQQTTKIKVNRIQLKAEGEEGDKKSMMSRIDLYQKLLDVYESERFRWAEFKVNSRPTDYTKRDAVDKYDRMLAYFAPIVDARLEALWAVVLIRGQYHRVRRYIGFMDVESSSEILLKAKENLRSSVMRSLDDTEDIYPVYFSPASWAQYLSTSFQPEDLLTSPENTREKLITKEAERERMIRRRNALQDCPSESNLAKLEKAQQEAKKAYDGAFSDLQDTYTSNVMTALNIIIDTYTKGMRNKTEALKALKVDEVNAVLKTVAPEFTFIDQAALEKFKGMQDSLVKSQSKLDDKSDAYSRAQLQVAQARSEDHKMEIRLVSDRIDGLTTEINYLRKVLKGAENPFSVPINVPQDGNADLVSKGANAMPEKQPLPAKPSPPAQDFATGNASIWQEVAVSATKSTETNSTYQSTSVSHSSSGVNFFFGSSSSSESSAASSANKHLDASNSSMELAFRVMKVTINRPWMNAGLLAQTKEFFHANAAKISTSAPSEVIAALTGKDTEKLNQAQKAMIPAWTKSFLIVKDLHVILSTENDLHDSAASDVQKSMESGGGFLCFGTHRSEQSSEHSASASVTQEGKRLSIKIPAPQIIGWVSQICPKDESLEIYNGLTDNERTDLAIPKEAPHSDPKPKPLPEED
ncbi:hypothetical protein PENCOP_c006G08050 [Penicillium coprophilum]|uniref:Uncharacterized protein n=1 Tax=Penicillium coprophilum TaxID=36646 RepID=A0A1V6UNW9_9EURO|nr:hypothetical protein PENCOP_c006G08050 [Penicillium coprophilum]